MRECVQKDQSGVRKGICTKRTNGSVESVGSVTNMCEGSNSCEWC